MRLLSWNIHKGIGGIDRRYKLDRIVEVIRYYNPDIVTLQEVDRDVPRSRRDHQTEYLAESLAYPYSVFGPNVTLKTGCYGNATLSRSPISHWTNIDLSFKGKKARGALYCQIRTQVAAHRFTIHLVNIHLGLSGLERRWQIRRLLESDDLTHLDSTSRIVVAGDTNDWSGALARGRLKKQGYSCVTGIGRRASLTFPSWQPVGALDRVFLAGALTGEHRFRSRLKLARQSSDHLPILVDLELLHR